MKGKPIQSSDSSEDFAFLKEIYEKKRTSGEDARRRTAEKRLHDLGFVTQWDEMSRCIAFQHNESIIRFWPWKGWFSGRGVKDGRGLDKLIKQLKR